MAIDREAIRQRASRRCEYCLAPEVITAYTFHVEHIVPSTLGGSDEITNLAYSCVMCNLHKQAFIRAKDPKSKCTVRLFHPRLDSWQNHFRISVRTAQISGRTAIGRATVSRLKLNSPAQTEARSLWIQCGLYP
jgi:hypothetical protein